METDLEFAKDVAKCLLYTKVSETEYPFFLVHPFITNRYMPLENNKELVDILSSDELLKTARDRYLKIINNAKDIWEIQMYMHKPYRTLYFKMIADALSNDDYNAMLAGVWVGTENVNQDVNVKIKDWIRFFKKADKSILMNENDLNVYKNLPKDEKILIYRGVGKHRNPNGLSWTKNFEKAKWFAKRWGNDGDVYIIKGYCYKKDIFAYFNVRDEDELVVNSKNVMEKERIYI